MSLEARQQDQNNSPDQSQSKNLKANNKTHHIKKSPKPIKNTEEPPLMQKKDSIFSSLRLTPQFGVFQSEVQKQLRLDKFWREQIDGYYKKQISQEDKQILRSIFQEDVPSLKEVIETPNQVLFQTRVPFEQLFRYLQIVKECRNLDKSYVLVQNQQKYFLGIFNQNSEIQKLIQVTLQQAYLIGQHNIFIKNLQKKQQEYNYRHRTSHKLSQISSEIAFMLYIMKLNKIKINQQVSQLQNRIMSQPPPKSITTESVEQKYISCLIRKNLKIALSNTEIDYFNYYANLDMIQQYGSIQPEHQRAITDKRQFEQYMKRKKSKKSRKNPKGVLKTACGGCLSPHYQQYNPFYYCPECHIRFHKYCYSLTLQGLCEPCSIKKVSISKGKIQCQLCPNRGLLSFPMKSLKQGISIHIFCMLINGLWKFQNGALDFESSTFVSQNINDGICCLCNTYVYTYKCVNCQHRAHPLCAYLSGWNLWLDTDSKVRLDCCISQPDKQKHSYRRKFILNYKKMLYKADKDR